MKTVRHTDNYRASILLADTNEIYLIGLSRALSKFIKQQRICSAGNIQEIFTLLENLAFDILIVDLQLIGEDLETLRTVRKKYPSIKMIGLDFNLDVSSVIAFMRVGGNGFLLKDTTRQELQSAVTTILNGERYFSKEIQEAINRQTIETNLFKNNSIFKKSLCRELLYLMVHECSTKEIATHLRLSERTVEKYRAELIKETGVKNMVGLAVFAMKNKIQQDENLCKKYPFPIV